MDKFTSSFFVISAVFLTAIFIFTGCSGDQQTDRVEWAVALHGGAGTISQDLPDSVRQQYYDGLEQAVRTGQIVLREGGSALDAVEQVVKNLEDNPLFNAGRGSVFTSEGTHELDAAIMDGSTMEAGALTGLTTVKNPVSLARIVMEQSNHIFFSGQGAEQYADQTDVQRVENDHFFTQNRYEQWQRAQEQSHLYSDTYRSIYESVNADKFGTVGAVALDMNGNLAAATSTGGMTNKQFGRVGDVPIIGSGTFANHVAAVSATGWGEKIMQQVSANTIANLVEFGGYSLQEAVDYLLEERLQPDEAGFIAVDSEGNIVMNMNTPGMFRGSIDSRGNKEVKIWIEE
ncbi:isoaspartyl peptidase/L-asparaginase [Rhodohalobacter sp. SW132]|uniref:isoaspartyl peptidase/L-asparaginase family protein n=1 Tax=Rhodohalobacter sp. SW132 TaxID=2293433 RepID=UPI000E272BF5|nr:isoaspartyl peptidase/L-asparaginase [Rhodohalobacter sp. SW132]REL38936.1 isoaspartyl peptidase/L-asparaginase [Rhodohalobacter sp. SW132]